MNLGMKIKPDMGIANIMYIMFLLVVDVFVRTKIFVIQLILILSKLEVLGFFTDALKKEKTALV